MACLILDRLHTYPIKMRDTEQEATTLPCSQTNTHLARLPPKKHQHVVQSGMAGLTWRPVIS